MKPYNCITILLIILSANYSGSAQNYPQFKSERITTTWDTDSTLWLHNSQVSLTGDGKLVMLAAPGPNYIPRFYFYDEKQKTWTKRELEGDQWSLGVYGLNYTLGMKIVLTYGSDAGGGTKPTRQGIKWIFNYGDSLFLDTITTAYHHPQDSRPVINDCVTPLVCYSSVRKFAQPRVLSMDGGPPLIPFNHYLYRRTNLNGIIEEKLILAVEGGTNAVPESEQDYGNGIYYHAIDSETIVAAIIKSYYIPPRNQMGERSEIRKYTLLTTNSGVTWKTISDTTLFPLKNSDNQWFLKVEPATYLYSSPRHNITPQKPVYYGFIDEHLEHVQIYSNYGNDRKGCYCLCNSQIDSTEKNKFLIYSIDNTGELQKFIIPNSTFEYPNVSENDSSFYDRKILYANDSLMYIQVITQKGTKSNYYYSQPQVYKIYLKEIVNSIAEQQSAAPLQPYPNPTDQTLRWNTPTGTAVITDALSRTLIEVPASAMEADVSGLAVGMYFLTIRNGMESAVRSFVVAR